ncbi:hypothetical protein MLD38_015864 [Melastoma candidum]|uniref:Uncharacterized protein n=1 Tax=Melastoma candidum TaxID=119954 RepID=A0ACB9RIV6_9MYRT|nr:hypothetical protein MLD38_015864 [Melastoma candidum]
MLHPGTMNLRNSALQSYQVSMPGSHYFQRSLAAGNERSGAEKLIEIDWKKPTVVEGTRHLRVVDDQKVERYVETVKVYAAAVAAVELMRYSGV